MFRYCRFKLAFYHKLDIDENDRILIKFLNTIQRTEGCG